MRPKDYKQITPASVHSTCSAMCHLCFPWEKREKTRRPSTFTYCGAGYRVRDGVIECDFVCNTCLYLVNTRCDCDCDWGLSDAVEYLKHHKPNQYRAYMRSKYRWTVVGKSGKHN